MIKWPEPVELNPSANSVVGHSDATLKQAVRDFVEHCANLCAQETYSGEAIAAIRALIKEIEA